jgi:hypothetical protein
LFQNQNGEVLKTALAVRVTRLGDFSQIGCFFTLGSFSKITDGTQIFGLLFSNVPVMYLFRQKMGWDTFWATFLQTHLVTLLSTLNPTINDQKFVCTYN